MQFQKAVRPLRGEISVPGDKSISHRAVMFGAISEGTTEVTNFLQGADCLSTISCFRSMGDREHAGAHPRSWKRPARAFGSIRRSRLRKQRNNDTPDLRHSCRPELFQYTDR